MGYDVAVTENSDDDDLRFLRVHTRNFFEQRQDKMTGTDHDTGAEVGAVFEW